MLRKVLLKGENNQKELFIGKVYFYSPVITSLFAIVVLLMTGAYLYKTSLKDFVYYSDKAFQVVRPGLRTKIFSDYSIRFLNLWFNTVHSNAQMRRFVYQGSFNQKVLASLKAMDEIILNELPKDITLRQDLKLFFQKTDLKGDNPVFNSAFLLVQYDMKKNEVVGYSAFFVSMGFPKIAKRSKGVYHLRPEIFEFKKISQKKSRNIFKTYLAEQNEK